MNPQNVLHALLSIETAMGRSRKEGAGYEARVIDLDIVFVEAEIIDTEMLKVPHPEMNKRKFVLIPLNDIAPKFVHPEYDKKVANLLEECEDESILEPVNIWLKNPKKTFDFSRYN